MPDPADHQTLGLREATRRIDRLQQSLERASGAPVQRIETPISWILLGADRAWKLKKPVRLPFVDLSELSTRRHDCKEEVRLNRCLAPDLYLGTIDVCESDGQVGFGGPGTVVDVAVAMRRFPDGALWSDHVAAGTLAPRHIDAMAERLAHFHRDAPVAPPDSPWGGAKSHSRTLQGLAEALDGVCALSTRPSALAALAPAWPALRAWLERQLDALGNFWDARLRGGHVREVHGDLHLRNVLLIDDAPQAFDGIDFDPALRWIEPMEDLAFLMMDLMAHGRAADAFRLLDGWLAITGDHAALPGLRCSLVARALVRTQVSALDARGSGGEAGWAAAARYLDLALRLSHPAAPRLALTHGLPGSGKSHAALDLVMSGGAVRLRSDVERKRLFGLAAQERSAGQVPGGIYQTDATERTYGRLRELAALVLDAGWPVVVDAACLRRDERLGFIEVARTRGRPAVILDCQAPDEVLRQRIRQRRTQGRDPSEADDAVLDRLSAMDETVRPDEADVVLVSPGHGVDAARLGWASATP